MSSSRHLQIGAKLLVATVTVAASLGVGWAALRESGPSACTASSAPVREARANALKAVEIATDSDDDARDAAAMALQRWQSTLERATRACGWAA